MLTHGGVERVPQDARGAAAAHDLRARHDRGQQGAADGRRPLPPLRLRAARACRRSPTVLRRVADAEAIEIPDEAVALIARSATGSFRDALGHARAAASPTRAATIALDDVLAVLGAADADLLFGAVDAVAAGDARAALLAAARLADSGPRRRALLRRPRGARARADGRPDARRGPGRARGHARAGRAPAPSRPRRVGAADVVRLLDLIAAALRAMKDGADAAHAARARARQGRRAGARPVGARRCMARLERLEAGAPAPAPAPPAGAGAPPRRPARRAPRRRAAGATAAPAAPRGAPRRRRPRRRAAARARAAPRTRARRRRPRRPPTALATEAIPPAVTAVAVVEPASPSEPSRSRAGVELVARGVRASCGRRCSTTLAGERADARARC